MHLQENMILMPPLLCVWQQYIHLRTPLFFYRFLSCVRHRLTARYLSVSPFSLAILSFKEGLLDLQPGPHPTLASRRPWLCRRPRINRKVLSRLRAVRTTSAGTTFRRFQYNHPASKQSEVAAEITPARVSTDDAEGRSLTRYHISS